MGDGIEKGQHLLKMDLRLMTPLHFLVGTRGYT